MAHGLSCSQIKHDVMDINVSLLGVTLPCQSQFVDQPDLMWSWENITVEASGGRAFLVCAQSGTTSYQPTTAP